MALDSVLFDDTTLTDDTPDTVGALIAEIAAARRPDGELPVEVQESVADNLAKRLRYFNPALLGADETAEYLDVLREASRQVSVEVILGRRKVPIVQRLMLLGFRDGTNVFQTAVRDDRTLYWQDQVVYSFDRETSAELHMPPACELKTFERVGDVVEITGEFRVPPFPGIRHYLRVGDQLVPAEREPSIRPTQRWLGRPLESRYPFAATITLTNATSITPVVVLGEGEPPIPVRLLIGRWARFAGTRFGKLRYYRREGRRVFRAVSSGRIKYSELTTAGALRAEAGFLWRARRAGAPWSTLWLRFAATVTRELSRRPMWLISDRMLEAGDNGEAFFRYAQAQHAADHPMRFVLRKDAPDYPKLRRVGRVIDPTSARYRRALLTAEVFASSQAASFCLNPFGENQAYLNDLLDRRFVFLQHGVILHDAARWLRKWARNIDVFVTSAPAERASILEGAYSYSPEQVALTGLPRFDLLQDARERVIYLAPTWRRDIAESPDPRTLKRAPHPDFANSSFARHWNDVIHDERLNAALAKLDFRAVFLLHPSHAAETDSFTASERISIGSHPADYRHAFNTAAVLVTDYSSIAFDFAYLRKPVVYAQWDQDTFFGSHYDRGYFSYDEDGFGPIATSTTALVDELIALLERDCQIDPGYRERIDRFFAFDDIHNSRRVYEAIEASLASGRRRERVSR